MCNPTLFITAKSHDVSEILDPTITPGPCQEEKELFEAQQIFKYEVFNETLLTNMDRTRVQKQENSFFFTGFYQKFKNPSGLVLM